jgi:hypothetical protein
MQAPIKDQQIKGGGRSRAQGEAPSGRQRQVKRRNGYTRHQRVRFHLAFSKQ